MLFGDKATYAANREVKVSVSNLTKRYDDLLVLDDINFDIYKGVCALLGRPGAVRRRF